MQKNTHLNKCQRLLNFIRFINQRKRFCTEDAANKLGENIRTIQRYKKEIEELFGIEFIKAERGCYAIPTDIDLESLLLDAKEFDEFEKFIDVVAMTFPPFLKYFVPDSDKHIKNNDEIYLIKHPPFEELKNFEYLKELKSAIADKHYIWIEYDADDSYFKGRVKPLKILFAENNWYLAVMSDDELNGGFKFLRINFIKKLIKKDDRYRKVDPQVEYFLENFQSLFSSFDGQPYEVQVKVMPNIARFFEVKKYLKSQKVLQKFDDGSLLLSFMINNENEILLLAKRWFPDFMILSPKWLKEEFDKLVRRYEDNSNVV